MAVGNIGLATYGTAFILGRSTNSWVQDFSFELRKAKELDDLTIESFLGKFREYFGPKVEEHRAKLKSEAGRAPGRGQAVGKNCVDSCIEENKHA